MPLNVRPYLPSDFNAWLDLTAISSIELNEEFLIWNARPDLPQDSFSYLLINPNQELLASVDLVWQEKNKTLLVKHWASRKDSLQLEFPYFLNEISRLTNASIQIWVTSKEACDYFLTLPKVKQFQNRVLFFVEGNVLPSDENLGFCDHVYGTCRKEDFEDLLDNLPFAKKDFMTPKFQSCLEFYFI